MQKIRTIEIREIRLYVLFISALLNFVIKEMTELSQLLNKYYDHQLCIPPKSIQ